MQTITRSCSIDFGHRVMNECYKCYNIHGHLGKIEITYEYERSEKIGYAIDFKEIKRVHCQFLDDYLDHGFLANPHDEKVINTCKELNSKLWVMSLADSDYCNPTAENIGKEIFLIIEYLTKLSYPMLTLKNIRFFETPNCWVDTDFECISESERSNFIKNRKELLEQYSKDKGVWEYDDRKITQKDK